MSSRHLSRSIVLQALFAWDFDKEKKADINEIIPYVLKNFGAGIENSDFVKQLVKGILEKKEAIDEIIVKAAPDWPLEQIAIIDRNVLRLGLYELLFGKYEEVPPKVAINEAIELAKTFGGETSGKFVNGVLGAVYKEIGEPGKDETGSPKKFDESQPPLKEALAGAVIYKKENGGFKFALVHDIFGFWTLSKGRLKDGEDIEKGAGRAVQEELGIKIEIKEKLGENEYIAFDPQKGRVLKTVSYFLAETKKDELRLESSGGLDEAKWFLPEELPDLKIYSDILPFLTKAIKELAN